MTKHILSLNDSPVKLDFYHRILVEAGYDSMVTTDEVEALTILPTQSIDLLIQDVQRPGMGEWIFLTA
jgi:CheY-like chemotaxis protein